MNDWKQRLRAAKRQLMAKYGPPAASQPQRRTVDDDCERRMAAGCEPMQADKPAARRPAAAFAPTSSPSLAPVTQSAGLAVPAMSPGVPTQLESRPGLGGRHDKWFKAPEDWVVQGTSLQIPGVEAPKAAIDIYIGFDFGTTFTKVAVGLLDAIYPIDWRGTSNAPDPYLLPSEYACEGDAVLHLGIPTGTQASSIRRDLKHPFLEPHVSQESIAPAAVFMALTLRYVRAWVYHHHRGKLGKRALRWHLNIGAPSNGLEDERLRRAYRRLGNAAWLLSQQPTELVQHSAQGSVRSASTEVPQHGLAHIDVFPEFVGQMSGYIQSPQRQRGLHALMDVGGGTLDFVTFIVHHRDDEDVFPFLVPEVRVLGTRMFNQNRTVGVQFDPVRLPDDMQPVLESDDFASAAGIERERVKARDTLFFRATQNVFGAVLGATKRRRYRLSDAWRSTLPTFVTGGGCAVGGYRQSLEAASGPFTQNIRVMALPAHPRLANFEGNAAAYQRISVACGLAQDAFSLGRIVPAKEVEDDVPVQLAVRERPDRDELYPK